MRPLPSKLPEKTVSITFQGDGITLVIRKDRRVHKYFGDRHRERLMLFVIEKGMRRVDRGADLTIYRNWS